MSLFSGSAYFSPSVPREVRQAWGVHGGTIVQDKPAQNATKARYCFCNGKEDPLLPEFAEQSIVVFHSAWISKAVNENFSIPMARYVLDARSEAYEKTNGSPPVTPDHSERLPAYSPPRAPAKVQRSHMKIMKGDSKPTPTKLSKASPLPVGSKKRPLPEDDEEPPADRRPQKRARTVKFNSNIVSTAAGRKRVEKVAKIPTLDLRKLAAPSKAVLKRQCIPKSSQKPRQDPDKCKAFDKWRDALDLTSSSPTVSVASALHSFRESPTTVSAVRFKPGTQYMGKKFDCQYARK